MKKLRIIEFSNVQVGKTFRHKKQWCIKTGHLLYIDEYARSQPAPKINTLVGIEVEKS